MLATLFFLAIWFDPSQPTKAPAIAYFLLAAYVAVSTVTLAVTWRNWWLDAKLAGPAHALDIILFTVLVFLTEGYNSPFFTFFVFVLLAAAIRWGWRVTALSAVLLTLLYPLAGTLAAASTGEFEVQRFLIRTGHLVILSLILIWFGINQWRSVLYARSGEFLPSPSLNDSPLETSLRGAMDSVRAKRGVFVWRENDSSGAQVLIARDGSLDEVRSEGSALSGVLATPFVYDLRKDRALARDHHRNLRRYVAHELVRSDASSELALSEGLAVPVSSETGQGDLFLEAMPNLSTDDIGLAEQLAADVAAHIQRHALIRAAEEAAEARSRLRLAGDLHDSVVQFLAGAAFRVEAVKRQVAGGARNLELQLNELKDLMLQEQSELRAFIAALRSGSRITLEALANDLRALADRLSRQWRVDCEFSAQTTDMMVPSRLHVDVQQLVREAVANAVRHAGARSIQIRLRAVPEELQLDFINDGARYPNSPIDGEMPRSLSERVTLAGGELDLTRGMGVTKISVTLPIEGRSH